MAGLPVASYGAPPSAPPARARPRKHVRYIICSGRGSWSWVTITNRRMGRDASRARDTRSPTPSHISRRSARRLRLRSRAHRTLRRHWAGVGCEVVLELVGQELDREEVAVAGRARRTGRTRPSERAQRHRARLGRRACGCRGTAAAGASTGGSHAGGASCHLGTEVGERRGTYGAGSAPATTGMSAAPPHRDADELGLATERHREGDAVLLARDGRATAAGVVSSSRPVGSNWRASSIE